jgi:hypothetical protein
MFAMTCIVFGLSELLASVGARLTGEPIVAWVLSIDGPRSGSGRRGGGARPNGPGPARRGCAGGSCMGPFSSIDRERGVAVPDVALDEDWDVEDRDKGVLELRLRGGGGMARLPVVPLDADDVGEDSERKDVDVRDGGPRRSGVTAAGGAGMLTCNIG